jgi:hypothetical protein
MTRPMVKQRLRPQRSVSLPGGVVVRPVREPRQAVPDGARAVEGEPRWGQRTGRRNLECDRLVVGPFGSVRVCSAVHRPRWFGEEPVGPHPSRHVGDRRERRRGRRDDLGDHDRALRRCSSGTRCCPTGPWSFAADADRRRPRARAAADSTCRVALGNRSRGAAEPNRVLWSPDYSNRGRSGSPDQSRSSLTVSTWCTGVRPASKLDPYPSGSPRKRRRRRDS